jgi:hypothetical protein
VAEPESRDKPGQWGDLSGGEIVAADLLILLHTFLDAASTAVRAEFGQS